MTTLCKTLILVTSMFAGLAGCDPEGQTPAADGGACKAVDAGGTVAELLGAWQHSTEMDTCVCDDGNTLTNSMASTTVDTFAAGPCSEQIVISDDLGCSLTCQVSGNTVTCERGTCEYDGVQLDTTSDVYTLTNGQLQETATGVMTLPSGATCQCTSTNAGFTRVQPSSPAP